MDWLSFPVLNRCTCGKQAIQCEMPEREQCISSMLLCLIAELDIICHNLQQQNCRPSVDLCLYHVFAVEAESSNPRPATDCQP